MKNSLYFILLILLSGSLAAQEIPLSKKEQQNTVRQQKKRDKAVKNEQSALKIEQMISNRRFVLEATMVTGSDGKSSPVGTGSNYVFMDVTRAAALSGIDDFAGVEGVRLFRFAGQVKNYEWSKNKRGIYQVRFEVMYGNIGVYEVMMDVKPNGYAVADLGRGGSGRRSRLSGNVKDLSDSVVSSELIDWE